MTKLNIGDQYIIFEALGMFIDALKIALDDEEAPDDEEDMKLLLERSIELRQMVNKDGNSISINTSEIILQ